MKWAGKETQDSHWNLLGSLPLKRLKFNLGINDVAIAKYMKWMQTVYSHVCMSHSKHPKEIHSASCIFGKHKKKKKKSGKEAI